MLLSSSRHRRAAVHDSVNESEADEGNGAFSGQQQIRERQHRQQQPHTNKPHLPPPHLLNRATSSSSPAASQSSSSGFASRRWSALIVVLAVLLAAIVLIVVRVNNDIAANEVDTEEFLSEPLYRRRIAPWYSLPSASSSSCSHIQPLKSFDRSTLPGIAALTSCASHSSNIAVVSSASTHPTAGMIGLTQLTTRWCVLVMSQRGNVTHATFTAGLQRGIESYVTAMRTRGEQNVPRAEDIDTKQLLARIAYIDQHEQRLLPYRLTSQVASGLSAPKNLGYLIALHAGASTIFDMADNTLYLPSTSRTGTTDLPYDVHHAHYVSAHAFTHTARGRSFAEVDDRSIAEQLLAAVPRRPTESAVRDVNVSVFNAHPVYGRADSWPRGFPIDWVHATLPVDPLANDDLCLGTYNSTNPHLQLCQPVIQHILSNHQPDTDAFYTATTPHPTAISDFLAPAGQRIHSFAARHAPAVAVPRGTYMPFNSWATVWPALEVAFGMLLPGSVPERIADVWRSYIIETVMSFMDAMPYTYGGGYCVAVTPPHVASLTARKGRRQSTAGATADSDLNLFTPVSSVLSWLSERQRGGSMNLERRVRDMLGVDVGEELRAPSAVQSEWLDMLMLLYVDMYEAGVLGESDIANVRAWLSDVQCIRQPQKASDHIRSIERRADRGIHKVLARTHPHFIDAPTASYPSACFPSYQLASATTESASAALNTPANHTTILASDGHTYPLSAYPHGFLWPDKSPSTRSNLHEADYYNQPVTSVAVPPPLRPYPPHRTPPKPRVDFVLRTFAGYSTLTGYMLRSLDMALNWRAVGDVIVVLDDSENDRHYAATLPDDVKVFYEPQPAWFDEWTNTAESANLGVKRSSKGYNLGVYSSWVADRYSDAEYICVLDPDMLMVTRNALPLMFDWDEEQQLYKPVWLCRDYPEPVFLGTSYRKMGLDEKTAPGCMQQLPVCVRRDLLRTVRLYMNSKYEKEGRAGELWEPYGLDPTVDRDSDYGAYQVYYAKLLAGAGEGSKLPKDALVPPSAFERTYVQMVNEDTFAAVCQFCIWGSYLLLHPIERQRYILHLQGDRRPESTCSHIRVGTHAAYLVPPPKISSAYYKLGDRVLAETVCRATGSDDCNRGWCEARGWWVDVAAVRSSASDGGGGGVLDVGLVGQDLLLKWETQNSWASEEHENKCKAYAMASIFQHYEWQQHYDLAPRPIRDKQCRTEE